MDALIVVGYQLLPQSSQTWTLLWLHPGVWLSLKQGSHKQNSLKMQFLELVGGQTLYL